MTTLMPPDAAAWVRDHVLDVLPCSITAGANHLDTACDRHPTGLCLNCATATRLAARFGHQEHQCEHGRPAREGRLRVAGHFPGPRGCRIPADPMPDSIWLTDRICRTYCACPCRRGDDGALFDLAEFDRTPALATEVTR